MAKTGNDSTIVEREALFDKIDVKQHQWKGLFAIYRQEIIQDVIKNMNMVAHISSLAVALAAVLFGSHSYRVPKSFRRSA